MLLGADNAAVLVHEQFLFSETGSAVGLVSGAVKHLGARTAQHLVLLAVDVIKSVGRTRVVSSHCFDWLYYSVIKEKKENAMDLIAFDFFY